jgi:S1-C subfamily serine protease
VDTAAEPIVLESGRPIDGTEIAISGYPLGEPTFVTTRGTIASAWTTGPSSDRFVEWYLGDITANPGNSGGPVYRVTDARVVGVCKAGKLTPISGGEGSQTAGLTIIVPAIHVAELMDRHGLSPLPNRAEPSPRRSKRKRR